LRIQEMPRQGACVSSTPGSRPGVPFGLGIPHVGPSTAADLAVEFRSLKQLANAGKESLKALEGVGETVASAIHQWLDAKRNRQLRHRLRKKGIDPREEGKGEGALDGKTLVLTGALSTLTREEAQDAIRRKGGRPTSSVSSNTDYLVVGSDPGETKLGDARRHDVETIDEDAFQKLMRGS